MTIMIVLLAGLPGSGKSTLARELVAHTSGRILSTDDIRHAIFLPEELEYSSRQNDFCVHLSLGTAAYLMQEQPTRFIFLAGRPFSSRYQIENVLTVAASLHQPWRILECVCAAETAKQRLEQRVGERHPAANRDYQ